MSEVTIHWFGHASFRLTGTKTVHIDPWKLPNDPGRADVVMVSHSHYDHCSSDDVAAVCTDATTVLAPADCVKKLGGRVRVIAPGQAHDLNGVRVAAVPAYNIGKEFHPKKNGWIGAVVEMDNVRVYYAGDTDVIPEMGTLKQITAALLPVGGTYTMDAAQAAEAANMIKPRFAVPYHWGDIVGDRDDATRFKNAAQCDVHILSPGTETKIR